MTTSREGAPALGHHHEALPHQVPGAPPIIEQAVERVDHAHTPEQLLNVGRHVQSLVLARALQYVLEHRVFINGHGTVVPR